LSLSVQGDVNQEEEKEGTNWHRRERRRGTYLRAFTLPDGVDPNSINAKFDKACNLTYDMVVPGVYLRQSMQKV
jgi:HSP20 family molecular chaperone IbpA